MGKAAPPFQVSSDLTSSDLTSSNLTSSPTPSPRDREPSPLGDSQSVAAHAPESSPEASSEASVQAQPVAHRSRPRIPGLLVLVSMALHGLVLALPVPSPAPLEPLEIEPEARLDRLDTVAFESAPEPEPEPELGSTPSPTPEPTSAPAPAPQPATQAASPSPRDVRATPAPPAPAAPPDSVAPDPAGVRAEASPPGADPPAPSPETEAETGAQPETAALSPPEVAPPEAAPIEAAPIAEEPQDIFGVPVLPGGKLISDLPNSLAPARLERYRQGGSRHPDILGQYLLRVPLSESPEDVFQQRYRDLFDPNEFRVEAHGALAGGGVSAPKYRLRRRGENTSQFITLERLAAPDQDKLLITIWRRLPS